MLMENILDIILNNTFTHTQLAHRVSLLKSHLSNQLFGGLEKIELAQEDAQYLNSLPKDFFQKFTKENITKTFEEIDEALKKIQPLTIYIPFELPLESLNKLSAWLKNKFGRQLVLDIRLDPGLIAGCALVWNGVYKDYSLKSRLAENKEKILEIFKEYFTHASLRP